MSVATQVRLANDIAAQFHHLPHEEGVTAVLNHIRSFWDRRMRGDLADGVDAGVWEIDRLAVAAMKRLRSKASAGA